MSTNQFISTVIQDTNDAILVLDRSGQILFHNNAASQLLGFSFTDNTKYASLMAMNTCPENDEFHQSILQSVYDKESIHRASVKYVRKPGDTIYLHTVSNYNTEHNCVIFSFTDVTELKLQQIQQHDVSFITAAIITFLCVWIYLVIAWKFFGAEHYITSDGMTIIELVLGLITCFICFHFTSMNSNQMGLAKPPIQIIRTDLLISASIILIMILIKVILLRVNPGYFKDPTFFQWNAILNWSMILYPVNVFFQEFITRGCFQEVLQYVFYGKYRVPLILLISSIMFGALHIHKGFTYMLITPFFLFFCSLLYQKQRNIWGLCIIHYVCLTTAKILALF